MRGIWVLLPSAVGFLGGFLTALFAEPIRRWIYQPKLELHFGNASHFMTRTPEIAGQAKYEAIYVRVKVLNNKSALAKSCRAYLVNIERKGPSGSFVATEYCEALQLGWAVHGEQAFSAVDLPTGVPFYVDVLSTRPTSPAFKPHVRLVPMRYEPLFSTPGTYRFTILASGDEVKPVMLRLVFKWSGDWEHFDVSLDETAV
jgi:hypothetical protein